MISADHFRDNGDGTAWWVLTENDCFIEWDIPRWFNRPCNLCDGGAFEIDSGFNDGVCPDCNGTGSHTFDVEVECWHDCKRFGGSVPGWARGSGWDWVPCWCDGTFKIALRVSIIPGMILPIIRGACPAPTNSPHRPAHVHLAEPSDDNQDQSGICKEDCDLVWDNPWKSQNLVTLPPAARPGMWAVKVRIA